MGPVDVLGPPADVVHDSITWKIDGNYYGKCNTIPTCQLKYNVPDNKTIWIEIAMDHRAH